MEPQEPLLNSLKFQAWKRALETNQVQIQSIKERYTRHGKEGGVLHALVELEAKRPGGEQLAPICFIKGNAVSIVVILINEENGEKSVLLVRQARVCDGSLTYEHPAGMIEDDETPLEVAVRELNEETGLSASPSDVKPLNGKPWFSATSTSDEALFFFYYEQRMAEEAIRKFHGQQLGKESENEHTYLHVASFPEAHRLVNNLHGVLGHFLYLQAIGDYQTMQSLPVI